MTIDIAGKVSIRRYWRLEPMGFAAYQSVEECSEAFLEVFGRAVDRRTRGRGSIAQMLSGGLDSAAIGVVASRALRNDKQAALETYSVVCDDMESSLESRCIVELVRSLGVRPCYVKVPSLNGSPGLSDLRDIAWNSPHPVDNELLIPAILSRAAARGGHELMLNGMAGDLTLFTPMYYQAWYISQGRLLTAWRECLGASRNNTIVNGIAPAALLWRSLRTALVPGSLRLLRSRTRSRRELRLRLDESLIRNELIEKYRLFDRIVEVEQRRAGQRKPELDRQILEAMFGAHGIGSGLTAYDRVARREGIELADPWADRDVVEFFAKVPLQFRVNRGWAKFLVRETFRDEMPAAVRRRKDKEHLGWMMTRRLMLESADIVGFLASSPQGVIDSYLDYAKVIARLKRHEGTNDETEWLLVFRLATVIMWIDQSRKKASAKWSIQ